MTLATHAVVGGTVAALFPSHPIIAFSAGFFSHFILDAIPHWDYKLLSAYANPDCCTDSNKIQADKYFILDLIRIGCDALLGLMIVFILWNFVFSVDWRILILGAIGGMLPDFLQFVYARFPYQPMTALQKFHTSLMHAEYRLNDRPIIGVSTQILTMIVVVVIVNYLINL